MMVQCSIAEPVFATNEGQAAGSLAQVVEPSLEDEGSTVLGCGLLAARRVITSALTRWEDNYALRNSAPDLTGPGLPGR